MKLILSRHGNTFDLSASPIWVGSQNDMPLVNTGIEQAKTFAKVFKQSGAKLNAIYCAPLKRTRDYAKIILEALALNLTPTIDFRLNELDYGSWSGLTNQQVCEKFGEESIEKWEKHCKWPLNQWGSSEATIRKEALSFANDLKNEHDANDSILIISSNGKLRYFLDLIPGEFDKHVKTESIKIKTGNICMVKFNSCQWGLNFWNKKPTPELFY